MDIICGIIEDVNNALEQFKSDGELSPDSFLAVSGNFMYVESPEFAMELSDAERTKLTEDVLNDIIEVAEGLQKNIDPESENLFSIIDAALEPLWAELAHMYSDFNDQVGIMLNDAMEAVNDKYVELLMEVMEGTEDISGGLPEGAAALIAGITAEECDFDAELEKLLTEES